MSSRKGGGKAVNGAATSSGTVSPSSKGKCIEGSGSGPGGDKLEKLTQDFADASIDPTAEEQWEVQSKKSKARSGKGGGKAVNGAATSSGTVSPSSKGKCIEGSGSGPGGDKLEKLTQDFADASIDPAAEEQWEVQSKKSKARSGAASKTCVSSASAPKAWGHADGSSRQSWGGSNAGAGRASINNCPPANDSRRPAGRGYSKPQASNRNLEPPYVPPSPAVTPPLQNGWQWASRAGSSGYQSRTDVRNISNPTHKEETVNEYDPESDTVPLSSDGKGRATSVSKAMSSRKGGGKAVNGAATSSGTVSPSSKGKCIEGSGSGPGGDKLEKLTQDFADASIDPTAEEQWEVQSKKSKARSGKGGGKAVNGAATSSGTVSPSSKGKCIEGSGSGPGGDKLEKLTQDFTDASIDPAAEEQWEVQSKKSKARSGAASKTCVSSASAPKAWGHADGSSRQSWGGSNAGAGRASINNCPPANDSRRPAGRGYSKPQASNRNLEPPYVPPSPAVTPPLQNGWQWASRAGSSGYQSRTDVRNISNPTHKEETVNEYDPESDTVPLSSDDGSDDDALADDSDDDLSDYEPDASQKSHETRKKSKWFKTFFDSLEGLTIEQVNEQSRLWHCPACKNGPGAIDWYKSLQPLVTHAKTKGANRVKLHRELAELLEEELRRRGTLVTTAGEVFGKWKGLRDTADHEIVWPPMVMVMNTLLGKDDNDKWIGMGNQELLEYFSQYAAVKARHSYGPQGHRGISVIIFEPNAVGYLEAERLHKHFAGESRDRDAWDCRPVKFYPGGKRQLYGYLAKKEDLDNFNQHCQGKAKLKFETKSYQEHVVTPMKQMSEDNQQLVWYKNKVVKQEQRSKLLGETLGVVSQKLRETMEENRIVRLRTKIQHDENKEEMDYQERFFKDQIAKIQKNTEEKEKGYEKMLQEERSKAQQFEQNSGTTEDHRLRKEEIERFIDRQAKGVEEFEAEREKLIHVYEENKVELKRKYLAEVVELEKMFEEALSKLMEKFAPNTFEASTSGY